VANVPSFLPRTIDAPRDGQCPLPQILSRTLAGPVVGNKSQIIAAFADWDSLLSQCSAAPASLTFDLEQCAQRAPIGPSFENYEPLTNRVSMAIPKCSAGTTGELLAECSATDTAEFKREV